LSSKKKLFFVAQYGPSFHEEGIVLYAVVFMVFSVCVLIYRFGGYASRIPI